MKEKPILFSGEMVRAIMDGRKTKTRRAVAADLQSHAGDPAYENRDGELVEFTSLCKYGQPGDRLWVKETFSADFKPLLYRATSSETYGDAKIRWTPSIFMPRTHSRITLEIAALRVERLHAIREADAVAEGIERSWAGWFDYANNSDIQLTALASYRSLWEKINGAGSWDKNPWVWVIEFKRMGEATV